MNNRTYIKFAFLIMFCLSCMMLYISFTDTSYTSYALYDEEEEVKVSTTVRTNQDNSTLEHLDISISNVTVVEADAELNNYESVEEAYEEVYEEPTEVVDPYISLTEDERYQLATLVYLEAGAEPYECQLAVASVVINRITTSGQSLFEVIYAKNQFTPARLISTSQPSDSTVQAVMEVCMNGPTIPEYVTYFRADRYHRFSTCLVDYVCIGNTYFSYDINLKDSIDNCEV